MKDIIALAFFSLFAASLLLIPVPMFTGNWFCGLIDQSIQEYVGVISAVFNGLFYGAILWLIFIGTSWKLAK